MSNDAEKEPIFAAPTAAYGGESAPIYQERTKTKQMVISPQSLLYRDHKPVYYTKCPLILYRQRSLVIGFHAFMYVQDHLGFCFHILSYTGWVDW